MMKRILLVSVVVLVAMASYSYAQMGPPMAPGAVNPGMMGGGIVGPGAMSPEMWRDFLNQNPECQKFLDDTVNLRKDLHSKIFEYFEAIRSLKTTGETASKLEKEIRDLQELIYAKAPLGCRW